MRQILKYISGLALSILFCSCLNQHQKNDLELFVENDSIYTIDKTHKCVNVLKFYIKNNSDNCYYINNSCENCFSGLRSDNINIDIYDSHDREINYTVSYFKDSTAECAYIYSLKKTEIYTRALNNNLPFNYYLGFGAENFFIHPGEIIYFERPIDLSSPVGYERVRSKFVDLDKNTSYSARVSIISDSTHLKSTLPRDILKTIKLNNAHVYHGKIMSLTIPLKVIEK